MQQVKESGLKKGNFFDAIKEYFVFIFISLIFIIIALYIGKHFESKFFGSNETSQATGLLILC